MSAVEQIQKQYACASAVNNREMKLESFGFFLKDYVIQGAEIQLDQNNPRRFTITEGIISFADGLWRVYSDTVTLPRKAATYFVAFTLKAGYVVNDEYPQDEYLPLWQINTDATGNITGTVDLRGPMGYVQFRDEIQGIVTDQLVVDEDHITPGAVGTTRLQDKAVTAEKLADGAVRSFHLAYGSVSSSAIQDLAVKTQHLANESVTEAKLKGPISESKLKLNYPTSDLNSRLSEIEYEQKQQSIRISHIITTPATSVSAEEIIDARDGEDALGDKIRKIDAQLDQIAVNVKNYGAKGDGITDDTTAIQQAIDSNDGATIFFPDGVYKVTSPIKITNRCSLQMNSNACLKAFAEMSEIIYYYQYNSSPVRRKISGGYLDCNGLANYGINVQAAAHLDLNILVLNPLQIGIYLVLSDESGSTYEVNVDKSVVLNYLDYEVNPNVIGLKCTTSDCTINDFVSVNCTKGIELTKGANVVNNAHVWITQKERFFNSVAFISDGTGNVFTNCYSDDYWTGLIFNRPVIVNGCRFRIGEIRSSWVAEKQNKPLFLKNLNPYGRTIITNCHFEYADSNFGTTVDVIDEINDYVLFVDNNYGLNSALTNKPLINKYYNIGHFRKLINGFTIPSKTERAGRINDIPDLDYRDIVVIRPSIRIPNGIILNTVVGNGYIDYFFYNVTDSDITVPDFNFYISTIHDINNQRVVPVEL